MPIDNRQNPIWYSQGIAAEHNVQWVGRLRADHTANATACKRANTIENALISQTPLQRMFGGGCLLSLCA